MKFFLMLLGIGLGIALGHMPSLLRRKPLWWRWLAITAVTLVTFFALWPPIAGSYVDAVIATRAEPTKVLPIYAILTNPVDSGATTRFIGRDVRIPDRQFIVEAQQNLSVELKGAGSQPVVVDVSRGSSDVVLVAHHLVSISPMITLPYIMGLEERARIIFFHVPMSWIAVIAYLAAMIYGIRYLRSRDLSFDSLMAATAGVGTLFAVLATTTGSVWAKFNWGTFWNWDPRQTSIVVLLLIYFALFLFRSTVDDPHKRARLSSVYAIVAFVTVPFLVFVLPRIMPGLHPGSKDDATAGPMLSLQSDTLNPVKQVLFGASLLAFTMVFYWIVGLRARTLEVERRIQSRRQS
jgi:heme exporter protein C